MSKPRPKSHQELIDYLAGQLQFVARLYSLVDCWWETTGRVTVDWNRLAEAAVGNMLAEPELLMRVIEDEPMSTDDIASFAVWAQRMSEAAHARQAKSDEEKESPFTDVALQEAWKVWVDKHGGWGGWVTSSGEFSHGHAAHGNAFIDARNGHTLGIFSVVVSEDTPTPPRVCTVCRSFNVLTWRTA